MITMHKTRLINKYIRKFIENGSIEKIVKSLVEEIEKWADKKFELYKNHTQLYRAKCSICKKTIDSKKYIRIYLDWIRNKLSMTCSEKCDRAYRLKNTSQLTGYVKRTGWKIHRIKEIEEMPPIVEEARFKKRVATTPWNNPKELWEEVKKRVKENKGEIIYERSKKNQ